AMFCKFDTVICAPPSPSAAVGEPQRWAKPCRASGLGRYGVDMRIARILAGVVLVLAFPGAENGGMPMAGGGGAKRDSPLYGSTIPRPTCPARGRDSGPGHRPGTARGSRA